MPSLRTASQKFYRDGFNEQGYRRLVRFKGESDNDENNQTTHLAGASLKD